MSNPLGLKKSSTAPPDRPEDSEQRNILSSPSNSDQNIKRTIRYNETVPNRGRQSKNVLLSEPGPAAKLARLSIGNVSKFKRWGMKRMVQRLRGLSAVERLDSKQVMIEDWEKNIDNEESRDQKESKWLLNHTERVSQALQLIITCIYIIACWYTSLVAVFQIEGHNKLASGVWGVGVLIDIVINLNTVQRNRGKTARTRYTIFLQYLRKESYTDLGMLLYVAICSTSIESNIKIGFSLAVIILLVLKLSRKSDLLRTYFDLKKYMVMVDSFMLLMVVAHISVSASITQALLLFLSSNFAPERNWLRHINIQDTDWGIKYIYSLYWSVTTIVTVGYGDITPQNEYEVIVTIFIELTGSALFGYIINVIGMTMTELKKDKQNLQEELSIAESLVKCLSLKEDLAYRLKSFLKDNQKADTYFSLKDERRIMDKLKPDLKQRTDVLISEILQETNIRVIKKCLFFLTYFSRNIQDAIALKLLKRVFQPNEILGSDGGHSLYIIDQGKAELQTTRMHFNKPICKTLRTINKEAPADKMSVSSNLFGFTAMVLRRPVNLTAVSKEFIITYELRQQDFDELVREYPADFETVCQIRDSIHNSAIPECYEGPEIVDSRLHYVPLKHYITRRHNRRINQRRLYKPRSESTFEISRYAGLQNQPSSETEEVNLSPLAKGIASIGILMTKIGRRHSDVSGRSNNQWKIEKAPTHVEEGMPHGFVRSIEEFDEKLTQVLGFDQAKSYSKYFVTSNIQTVLKRFNPTKVISTKQARRGQINFRSANNMLVSFREKSTE